MNDLSRPKIVIQWMLGNKCNYNCSYCLDSFKRGDHGLIDNDLLLEVSKDIIYHYDDLGRDVVFEFLGGEPTLVEKIPDIGNRLHNFPTNIVLKTNGSASLDWWKKTRRYLTKVIISVHKEFADMVHIENVVRVLQDNIHSHPVEVELLFPVTNRDDSWDWGMYNVKKFRDEYDIGDIQLLYSNFGRGSNLHLPYSERHWDEYHELYGYEKEEIEDDNHYIKYPGFKGMTCYAGLDILVIDSLGNVFRGWCMQGGKIGNIKELPIKWPTDTIICNKDHCVNGFDRNAKKV